MILVVDRRRDAAIVDRLRRAGHRIIDLDDREGGLQRLLEPSPEPIPEPTGEQAAERVADTADGVPSDDHWPAVHQHAGIHLDLHQRIVRVQDRIVEVSRLEFELLAALMESPRRVLTHGELAERVWENCDVETKTISMLVSRLRRRIIAAGGPRIAHAVPGVGYRLAYGT